MLLPHDYSVGVCMPKLYKIHDTQHTSYLSHVLCFACLWVQTVPWWKQAKCIWLWTLWSAPSVLSSDVWHPLGRECTLALDHCGKEFNNVTIFCFVWLLQTLHFKHRQHPERDCCSFYRLAATRRQKCGYKNLLQSSGSMWSYCEGYLVIFI